MKRPKSRFNSWRFTTPTPFQTESNVDPLATILLRAEISFLATLGVFFGIYIARFSTSLREVSTSVEEFSRPPVKCSPGSPLQADHPLIIPRSSFVALEWPYITPPTLPSSLSQEVVYLGPRALLESDSIASCFAFSGSSGGALLVSTSEKYAITRFTLDNSMVDEAVDSVYYPKEGALWGLLEGPVPERLRNTTTSFVAEDAVYIVIGNFCFSSERGPVQTFSIDGSVVSLPTIKFSVFYLEVSSNWGGSYTCLGRIWLHGNH